MWSVRPRVFIVRSTVGVESVVEWMENEVLTESRLRNTVITVIYGMARERAGWAVRRLV